MQGGPASTCIFPVFFCTLLSLLSVTSGGVIAVDTCSPSSLVFQSGILFHHLDMMDIEVVSRILLIQTILLWKVLYMFSGACII